MWLPFFVEIFTYIFFLSQMTFVFLSLKTLSMKKLLLLLFLPLSLTAQVNMTTSGSHVQNFNTLNSTGTATWTDNSTIANWYSQRSGTGTNIVAGDGSSNTGNLYSFGTVAATERALGTVGSGTAGNFAHGVFLRNTSGSAITSITVAYTLEQWRNSAATANTITFWYKTSTTPFSALDPNVATGWTQVMALSSTTPITGGTASALDGNLPANRVSIAATAIPSLNLANNDYIMFKWEDPDHLGSDHGTAIDDVTITWTTGPCLTYYQDLDGDTFGNPAVSMVSCTPVAGYVTNSNDCDDSNPAITTGSTYYQDADSDGYGNPSVSMVACSQPLGFVSNNLDCNDSNPGINPGATDIPDNGIDEDCNGSDASAVGPQVGIYEFTAAAACPVTATGVTAQPANATFSEYTTQGTSCSSAANVFNNSGWNQSGTIDLTEYNQFRITAASCYSMDLNRIIFTHRCSASGGTPTWILRSSVDNYAANIATGQVLTTDKIDTINLGAAFNAVTDVTFRLYLINMGASGATWRNDNVKLYGNITSLPSQTYYQDMDGDSYGNPAVSQVSCTQPVGYVLNNTDCNDNDAAVNPATVWYQDLDGDTYGNPSVSFTGCVPPANYVLNNLDCDDANPLITAPTMYYVDADGDSYGDAITGANYCSDPGIGYVTNNLDCNDADPNIHPASVEICDGVDNDCNSMIDDGLTFVNYYVDSDGDSYGTGAAMFLCQDPGAGYATQNGDCDDNNASVYPGATEILNNGIDENCDGTDNYVGINEPEVINFNLYPNPSNGTFNVVFETTTDVAISCFDLNGKKLYDAKHNASEVILDLNSLVDGTYILSIETARGITQKRIVIQK